MTKSEKEHLNRVASVGCIVCFNEGLGKSPAEIHHIRDGQGMSQRSSHFQAIPLCPIHHRTGGGGHVGFHQSPKGFQERYGSESALLGQVLGLIDTDKAGIPFG